MSDTIGTILVTRQMKDEDLAYARSLDLEVVCVPMLSFEFPEDWTDQIRQISTIKADSWIFTSKNGVLGFEELIKYIDYVKPKINTFAVGRKTAGELIRLGYKPYIPKEKNAVQLAKLIIDLGQTNKAIHFCGNRRRRELSKLLKDAGIKLDEIEVYRTVTHPKRDNYRDIHNILFYSPSAVEAYYKERPISEEANNFAIGPTTAKALSFQGAHNIIMAEEPSTESLLMKVHEYLSRVHED
ncbi:MAG TPA: uroporphyrinogen-III synthase [Balneolales bacterium]|nr:uroporphyrinogen-III synthase [Balneolales bacterium]